MNQAAINALSLAALFAQAQEAAFRGELAWVVLDDPVQSLDEAHQQGVLIGVVPSALVERLKSHVPVDRRFLHLAPWDPDEGSQIDREEHR